MFHVLCHSLFGVARNHFVTLGDLQHTGTRLFVRHLRGESAHFLGAVAPMLRIFGADHWCGALITPVWWERSQLMVNCPLWRASRLRSRWSKRGSRPRVPCALSALMLLRRCNSGIESWAYTSNLL